MEQITLGQIGLGITFLVGLIGGIGYLKSHLKEWIVESLKEEFEKINKRIADLDAKISDSDLNATKNYLVQSLTALERGESWDEIQKERFYEEYEHYQKAGGNSYIKQWVEKFKREGKI